MSGTHLPEPRTWQRYWPNVLLFVTIAAALFIVQWITNAHKVLHELGDFAANSLLILDAKHLHLLYGNYSRIGVHHPGPAILYVLAAGEALFHDLLHIAPSPFSGQLLAVCFYSAAWIVMIFAIMRDIAGARLPALLFTAVFTATLGLFEPTVFLGPWFPDLYILPFAVVVIAISRLAFGHANRLRALAVASGFVINGHVSFIPMLGVMLIAMLAANLLISLRDPDRRILSVAFLKRHRREILISIGILFLFFVPLLILSLTEHPGPIHDYMEFGGQNKHNPLRDSLKFVGAYWTPDHAFIWGGLLALLLVAGVRAPRPFLRDARALGIAFVAASLALLVYARFGIDYLDRFYLGLFYYSVPALAAGLLALYAYQAIRWQPKTLLAVVVSAAALGATVRATLKPSYYDELYDIHGSAQLYDRLRALPGTGRIVLDVEQKEGGWDFVWGDVVALELYARRQGQDLLCINQSWHLLFTRPARCRPEELNNPRHFYVRPMRMRGMVDAGPDIEGQGLLLYRYGRVLNPVAFTTVSEHADLFRSILGRGWSKVDGEYVWSEGPVAEINLPADPARTAPLQLDLGAFIPRNDLRQHVDVYVDGKLAGSGDFDKLEPRTQVRVALPDPRAAQRIELRIAHPFSPMQYDWGPDARLLGVSIYGIK